MTIIEKIIGRKDGEQENDQQYDCHILVALLLTHLLAIGGKRGVGRQFLEQARIYLVVLSVFLPAMQGETCHGTLIAHVEDDIVVGINTVAKPFQLGRHERTVA